MTQLIHDSIDLLCVRSLRIEDRIRIVEDDEGFLGGEEGLEGCQILWVLDLCTDDLGEPGEKMKT